MIWKVILKNRLKSATIKVYNLKSFSFAWEEN